LQQRCLDELAQLAMRVDRYAGVAERILVPHETGFVASTPTASAYRERAQLAGRESSMSVIFSAKRSPSLSTVSTSSRTLPSVSRAS
jgi:hypothetical protein